jgi:hypothetical protein
LRNARAGKPRPYIKQIVDKKEQYIVGDGFAVP